MDLVTGNLVDVRARQLILERGGDPDDYDAYAAACIEAAAEVGMADRRRWLFKARRSISRNTGGPAALARQLRASCAPVDTRIRRF